MFRDSIASLSIIISVLLVFVKAQPSTTYSRIRNTDSLLPLPPEQPFHAARTPHIAHTELQNRSPLRRIDNQSLPLPLPPSPVPTSLSSPIPKPLDTSLSYSLSSTCLVYLTTLVSSSTFLTCLPFSLLLTTSSAYSTLISQSTSTGNYTLLNNLISYTSNPQPSIQTCDTYMNGIGKDMWKSGNCGNDLEGGNVVVEEAEVGVGNYEVLRKASAVVDGDGRFCYLKAVEDERPDDLYLWSLPAGIPLPSTFTPTCSNCSVSLLNTYTSFISTTPTLNSTIIKQAINQINAKCGSNFISYSVNSTKSSAAAFPITVQLGKSVVGIVGICISFILGMGMSMGIGLGLLV